jgi:long-subunit acyl-CoA synthetase (AMP-forming)
MSECTGATTFSTDRSHKWGSCGYAMPGTEVIVVNTDTGQPVGPGAVQPFHASCSCSSIPHIVSCMLGGSARSTASHGGGTRVRLPPSPACALDGKFKLPTVEYRGYFRELCYRGRHVMMGYLANPSLGEEHVAEIEKKTADAIDAEGWLHSADKGCVVRKPARERLLRYLHVWCLSIG